MSLEVCMLASIIVVCLCVGFCVSLYTFKKFDLKKEFEILHHRIAKLENRAAMLDGFKR